MLGGPQDIWVSRPTRTRLSLTTFRSTAANGVAPSHAQNGGSMFRRKRKALDEDDDFESGRYGGGAVEPGGGTTSTTTTGTTHAEGDDRMSASPSNSPAVSRPASSTRNKRIKSNMAGRPLAVNRLLEVLDAPALRNVLQSLSDRHPQINSEIYTLATPPTVDAAMGVLAKYENNVRNAIPYGGNAGSDYAYNRVRQPLTELLDSLTDFTPHFLPPNEAQMTVSLRFLDGATEIIHRLPTWTNSAHHHHKSLAYEEISKAWALVIREAAKKGGGIQLRYGGWDQKLVKHNELAQGRMNLAMNELRHALNWIGGVSDHISSPSSPSSFRNSSQSGIYPSHPSVRVGSSW